MPRIVSPPKTGDEKSTLRGFLDLQRAIVPWKVIGLDEQHARRPMVQSGTNLLSIVKHLAWVEAFWFLEVMGGWTIDFPHDDDDPDAEMRIAPGETVADILALYEEHVAAANQVIDELQLDTVASFDEQDFSLRYVMLHMIDETARHLGHMDIVREQLDGATGYAPPPDGGSGLR